MLQSIRFMKMYSLEGYFEEQVRQTREDELAALLRMKLSVAASYPLALTVPIAVATCVLGISLLVDGELPAGPDTLAVLAICRFMFFPCAFFGIALGGLNIVRSASARLTELLVQPEAPGGAVSGQGLARATSYKTRARSSRGWHACPSPAPPSSSSLAAALHDLAALRSAL